MVLIFDEVMSGFRSGPQGGATGVAQVAEIVHQLRGDIADERRRAHQPSIGLTHNVGGSGGSAVVSILGLEA